ncbi:MAG TPA: sigma 54-interacting transcriptional regulator [Isosphaeraceae bacterium]|nr:sigma 54-interacting transcriptional regulator [Isosphaeraceae bacterium]
MERYERLLLDVWREVCRHTQIEESVDLVAAVLARRLPLDLVLVRHLEPSRRLVETLATGVCRPGRRDLPAKTACGAEEFERLMVWCRRGEVVRGPAAATAVRLPGLLPAGLDGEVLAGPLEAAGGGPTGLLVLVARPPRAFRDDHGPLLAALLEPFSVALENDRRLRELTSLREAVEADNRSLLSRLERHDISDSIVGAETGLRPVMHQIELVERSDAPVLVLGETGSGKEVVARAIHSRSRRASGPFLRVNCGAIPPELVDSELFGHERGSFTGAVGERKGWFERADGGTLFLDEVGELPPAAQVRLLRVLQDGQLERVGGERSRHVDVRIVAATHRDLRAMVADGRFREDLWYRIAVFPVRLPPLRERVEDIPALAGHFALRAARRLGTPPAVPTPEDIGLLVRYPWPGNVRELAAVIERAAILGGGTGLDVANALGSASSARSSDQPAAPRPFAPLSEPDGESLSLDAAMARHIEAALARTRGRVEGPDGAAERLGINPHTLRARMRKLGVDWRRFRAHTRRE